MIPNPPFRCSRHGFGRPRLFRRYTNPVLDQDFPDPAIIRASDGYYYAYATQTFRDGEWINIQVARSADLIHWEHLGDALPEKPEWARDDPGLLGAERHLRRLDLLHVLFGNARRLP